MNYLLGVDLGTSSLKTVLMAEDGRIAAIAAQGYEFSSPYNGYAEQDPQEWWDACCITIKAVLEKSGVSPKEIRGVSFSGQMHGLVALDENFQTVRPAILHCDARSDRQVRRFRQMVDEDKIQSIIMNPPYTGFLLISLMWMKEEEPENYNRTAHVMLPKDYLKYRLTGRLGTDYSDASATLAFDIQRCRWSEEILNILDIPVSLFPECLETTSVIGNVSAGAARDTGLTEETIVVSGGGDQVMQGIGNGAVKAGDACVNIGTSGQFSVQSDSPIQNPALNTNTFCGYKKDRWYTMGAIMNAGLALKWFNSLFGKTDYDELNARIAQCKAGSGGVIFLPYLTGERTPHVNPNLSGMFAGLNTNTGKTEMARAVMEGVAFALNQCMEICRELGLGADRVIASGGAAKSPAWLQIQSDIYNVPLIVADTEEQAGMGAAIAAGVGVGLYRDIEEGCRRAVKYKNWAIEPNPANHRVYQEYYEMYKELYLASSTVIEKITLMGRQK